MGGKEGIMGGKGKGTLQLACIMCVWGTERAVQHRSSDSTASYYADGQ